MALLRYGLRLLVVMVLASTQRYPVAFAYRDDTGLARTKHPALCPCILQDQPLLACFQETIFKRVALVY